MNQAVISLPAHLTEFVRTTAHNLETQDNRMTSHPIFVVESANITFQVDPELSRDGDMIEDPTEGWFHDESLTPEKDEAILAFLDENETESDDGLERPVSMEGEPGEWHRMAYSYRWKREAAFLTDKAARDFIKTNRHNLPGDGGHEPRVYVESGYRNKEHQLLVELIKTLAPQL